MRRPQSLYFAPFNQGRDEVYTFSPGLQPLRIHTKLSKSPAVVGVTKILKCRGQFRRITITISKALYNVYFDDDDNPRFMGEYLEEIVEPSPHPASSTASPKKQSLQSVTKDAVISKFNGTSPNPKTWMVNLERKCSRLEIPSNRNCEVLRLFVEGTALDWFNTTWTLHGDENWEFWKKSFLDHFATRRWSGPSYTYNYKYIHGSLSEYVIKKLSLLADYDPDLPDSSRILTVVAGIPYKYHINTILT